MEKPNTTAKFDRIFNDGFRMVSYNFENDRMLGMDVEINRNGKAYHLSIESWPLHMARADSEDPDTELEETTYVIAEAEIFPSDVAAIRDAPFEQIAPYLVEQE